jgi:hypothetical protein
VRIEKEKKEKAPTQQNGNHQYSMVSQIATLEKETLENTATRE